MPSELRARALRLLARREHSRAELRRKLTDGSGTDEALDALLDELVASHLLSDERFAEQRVQARCSRIGNARMASELKSRGVDDLLIRSTLELVGDEIERAQSVWRKKFGGSPANRLEWARQARFLQSRGFTAETIRRVLDEAPGQDGND